MQNLELFQGKVVCPLCNDGGGGSIYKAELRPIQKIVYICDECDALWERPDQITNHLFMGLGEYARLHGYSYDMIDVKNINYFWYKP